MVVVSVVPGGNFVSLIGLRSVDGSVVTLPLLLWISISCDLFAASLVVDLVAVVDVVVSVPPVFAEN